MLLILFLAIAKRTETSILPNLAESFTYWRKKPEQPLLSFYITRKALKLASEESRKRQELELGDGSSICRYQSTSIQPKAATILSQRIARLLRSLLLLRVETEISGA